MNKTKVIYSIERKKIKSLKITVKNTGEVIVSSPWFYPQWQIDRIIQKKADWIKKRLQIFEDAKDHLALDDSKIHYMGEDFLFVHDEALRSDLIDHEKKIIRSKKDLTDKMILDKWYRSRAKDYLVSRTLYIISMHSFKTNKISVRAQKTRWGSCSAKDDISLNLALIKCPIKISDYVIYHELAHTIEKNHSKRFWDILGTFIPDYAESRKWLKRYGNLFIRS